MTELPQAFLSQMAAQLKGEMAAFLRTYDEPYQRGLRVNPWKRPTLLPDDCGERVPWEENGHYLALTSTAGADVLHEAGAWYLQEPSAMLPAAVLNATNWRSAGRRHSTRFRWMHPVPAKACSAVIRKHAWNGRPKAPPDALSGRRKSSTARRKCFVPAGAWSIPPAQ